jgi:hypothetical protein
MATNPWQALDRVTGHRALPHVWEPILAEHHAAFKLLCLQPTTDLGGSIPCPNCACYHRIIPRNDRTGAIAVCRCDPPNCHDIPLTIDQVTPWQLNPPRLGRAIARALGCPIKIDHLTQPNTLQFATWPPENVPVLLTLQTRRHLFRRVIAELLTLGRPYILFAPTNTFMDAGSQQLLAHAKAAFFTLDATVRLTENGTLEAVRPATELFAAFTPESDPRRAPAAPPRYALRKGLRAWELYFDAQRAILNHERGIFYVFWLLYHPDETPIHAIDLMAKVPEIYREQLGLGPLVDPTTGKSVELASDARLQERSLALDDRQAMRAILKKQQELDAILDSDSSEPEKAEALRELEQITEFQKHHARRSTDSANRAVRTVRQALVRFHNHLTSAALQKPDPTLSQFAAHISKNILQPSACTKRPGHFCYTTPPATTWTQ